ncbi:MAG: phytanoyl-CoA dioxygenase family protein [Planctomycetota bacterium]|nr:phytanoyl-CoA dioxygenase family protein [Planctomycetota bacterium]
MASRLDIKAITDQLLRQGYAVIESVLTEQETNAYRTWIKPFTDFRANSSDDLIRTFSATVRYLMGHSASSIARG